MALTPQERSAILTLPNDTQTVANMRHDQSAANFAGAKIRTFLGAASGLFQTSARCDIKTSLVIVIVFFDGGQ